MDQGIVEAHKQSLDELPPEARAHIAAHLLEGLEAKDLKRLSPEALEKLRGVLPVPEGMNAEVSISRGRIARACNLQVEDIGKDRTVTFTIPEGVETLRGLLERIETANPREGDEYVIWPTSKFLSDDELDKKIAPGTMYNMTICFGAIKMTRLMHENYLRNRSLSFTKMPILAVGAALYRDELGFPPERDNIGTERDPGDLFKGRLVRAHSRCAIQTYPYGIYDDRYHITIDSRADYLVVAGSSLL